MPKRMRVLQLKSVGLVDAGACEGAVIEISKRRDPEHNDIETIVSLAEKAGRKMSTSRLRNLRDAVAKLTDLLAQVDQEEEMMSKSEENTFDLSTLPEDARKHFEQIERKAVDAVAEAEALKAKVAELEASKAEEAAKAQTPEDVLKSLPEDVRKHFEDIQKQAQRAEETAKAERDARLNAQFVAKCEKELPAVTAKASEFGLVLKRASEALKSEDFDEIVRVLKAASEQLVTSELFKAKGHGDEGSSAREAIAEKARELIAGNPKLSAAQARNEARKRHPELAQRERIETN